MPSQWHYFDTGPQPAAYNMAVDEELLARAQAGERMPVLRFYAWSPPAVSVGRFQDMSTAVDADACRRHGFDIVRRVTGGRAVLHRNELTYSIVARTDHALFPSTVLGTYKVIAAGLVAGLRNLGLPAEMVSRGGRHAALVKTRSKDAACFSSPSWYEILVGSGKIVGSAQRRLSNAFLQHGSILLDHDPDLEADVIRSDTAGDAVTSIRHELGREICREEAAAAILKGFRESLGISFRG
jgi:lipoate-protein ligase A